MLLGARGFPHGVTSLRLLGVTVCVLGSVAIFAHHSVPAMDMDGVGGMAETCVAVAAHVGGAVAGPPLLVLAFVLIVVLSPALLGSVFASRPSTRARAGPAELRVPLRC